MKPTTAYVLAVLRTHPEGVSALDFKRGRWGVHIDAVSQRVGELRALGYGIEGGRHGHAVATYRLTYYPYASVDVHDFAGALFAP